MSKRRRGFPSETKVKRGVRIVHGDKLLEEKLGRTEVQETTLNLGSDFSFGKAQISRR